MKFLKNFSIMLSMLYAFQFYSYASLDDSDDKRSSISGNLILLEDDDEQPSIPNENKDVAIFLPTKFQQLPVEILHDIDFFMTNIRDHINFRYLLCKQTRSAFPDAIVDSGETLSLLPNTIEFTEITYGKKLPILYFRLEGSNMVKLYKTFLEY